MSGVKQMLAAANAVVPRLDPARAREMANRDDVLILDVRDAPELQASGKIKGAVHVPRGMLEFWIDPQSPYAKPIFQDDKTFIFHCAGGLRSSTTISALKRRVPGPWFNVTGGMGAWLKAGYGVTRD